MHTVIDTRQPQQQVVYHSIHECYHVNEFKKYMPEIDTVDLDQSELSNRPEQYEQRLLRAQKALAQSLGYHEDFLKKAMESKGYLSTKRFLTKLKEISPQFEDISDLSFLDLGAGNHDQNLDGEFPPTLARRLAAMGAAEVVGVDAGRGAKTIDDVYHHLQLTLKTSPDFDLKKELKENGLPTKYSVIHTTLADNTYIGESPTLRKSGESAYSIREKLFNEWAPQLLEPGGAVVLDHGLEIWVLNNENELVRKYSLEEERYQKSIKSLAETPSEENNNTSVPS
jgi:hypothetical protein